MTSGRLWINSEFKIIVFTWKKFATLKNVSYKIMLGMRENLFCLSLAWHSFPNIFRSAPWNLVDAAHAFLE